MLRDEVGRAGALHRLVVNVAETGGGPPAAELARTVPSKASISCIENIGPSLETGDSFLTIKNSQGETVGTFRSSAVDGWWIEEEIDLASRLNAARARLARLGSGSAGNP